MSLTNNVPAGGAIDGTPITVPTTLEGASAYINGQALAIADELAALKNQLVPLEGTWSGTAAADFQTLKAEWDVAAQGLIGGYGAPGVLGEIAQAMGIAWGNYSDAEFANAQTWTSGTTPAPPQ
jgi:WXG100 family type VII secretion target